MWTLGTVRLFVQSTPLNYKQIIARLQPLDAGTTHQIFGHEDPVVKVSAIFVGETDKGTLEEMYDDGSYYELTGDLGSYGNFYISNMTIAPRLGVISQSIRTDLPCTSTVYDIELELFKT